MIVPGKLYSYCGASKIPMWDGDLLQERSYSNCIGQLKQNDIIMVIDVLHIRKKHFQSVTHIKLLNTNYIYFQVRKCGFRFQETSMETNTATRQS